MLKKKKKAFHLQEKKPTDFSLQLTIKNPKKTKITPKPDTHTKKKTKKKKPKTLAIRTSSLPSKFDYQMRTQGFSSKKAWREVAFAWKIASKICDAL